MSLSREKCTAQVQKSPSWQSSDDLFFNSPKLKDIQSTFMWSRGKQQNLTFEEPVPENVWLFACEITLSSQTMKQHCSVFPTERLCAFFLNCFESLPTAHNSGPTRLSSPVLSTSLPHYSFFFNSCGWASTGGRLLLIMKPFETKETNFCTEWKCNNQAH